mgnify:FL=1
MEQIRAFIPIIFGVLCYVFFYKPLKQLYIKLISKQNTAAILALFILTGLIYFLGAFALAGAKTQMAKDKDKLFSKIIAAPSNQATDELIAHIQQYGCENHPNAWNKLRSVWITINESPNVSTEKKKQLKQFLMLQGLTMHYQDSKIIDNCKL